MAQLCLFACLAGIETDASSFHWFYGHVTRAVICACSLQQRIWRTTRDSTQRSSRQRGVRKQWQSSRIWSAATLAVQDAADDCRSNSRVCSTDPASLARLTPACRPICSEWTAICSEWTVDTTSS